MEIKHNHPALIKRTKEDEEKAKKEMEQFIDNSIRGKDNPMLAQPNDPPKQVLKLLD